MNTARASHGLISNGREERPVPLESTRIRGRLQDLIAEIEITQRYRHSGPLPLERLVYSFRLPVDALLLGVEVQWGERRLVSRVIGRSQVGEVVMEARDGDRSAIWLEPLEPGLYRFALDHLEPGTTLCLVYRFAVLLRYSGRLVRLGLPLGPIPGGDVSQSGPEAVPLNEPLLDLELRLWGQLSQGDISSPTHGVKIRTAGVETRVHHLSTQGMERDFLLLIDTQSLPAAATCLAADKDGWVVHASFLPALSSPFAPAPRGIQLMVDCSGSMNGTAIVQARRALLAILGSLRPEDRFSLLRFGSSIDSMVPNLLPASRYQIDRVEQLVSQFQADLGGTELLAALAHVLEQPVDESCPTDVLIITDGEMWEESDHLSQVIELARVSRRRLFTVGVGKTVCVPMLRSLSLQTGGAVDLVDPGEGMAERIYRHFERLYAPRFTEIRVDWPGAPDWAEQPDMVFAGDTLHLFAHYAARPEGQVILHAGATGQQEVVERVGLTPGEVPPEWATPAKCCAAARLATIGDPDAATALAIEYQLLSPHTACLVVPEQATEEMIDGLSIRPQGSDQPQPDQGAQAAGTCIEINSLPGGTYSVGDWGQAFGLGTAPHWDDPPVAPAAGAAEGIAQPQSWDELLEVFTDFLETATAHVRERRIFTPEGADLPREWAEALLNLAGRFGSEGKRLLLIAFLNALLEVAPDAFPNTLGQIVRTKAKDLSLPDQVEKRLAELFSLIKAEISTGYRWGS